MLMVLAFAMVAVFMTLIMTRRLSAMVALVLVPTMFALILGHGSDLGPMMLTGIKDIAATGIMLIFAILYFGVMIDAGLFEPVVDRVVAMVGDNPVRINLGVLCLAWIVGLDGDGSTTYMITVAAMLPIYRRLRLDVRVLACLTIMASAISNMLPWGGPVARAATALKLDAGQLFVSMLPAMVVTAIWVIVVAVLLGRREQRRLTAERLLSADVFETDPVLPPDACDSDLRRPRLLWFNFALTIALMVMLTLGVLPLPVLFLLAFAVALSVNYPALVDQRQRLHAHAGNALAVGGLVFAAGIFTGVLSGTGMVKAMADGVIASVPPAAGPYLATITAFISMPFTFLISNDAFYFGMLPVLAEAGRHYGFTPLEMARAALVGQQIHLLSPLVPSTYLLVGMVGIEMGDHQRFTMRWAVVSCLVFLAALLLFGGFPLIAH